MRPAWPEEIGVGSNPCVAPTQSSRERLEGGVAPDAACLHGDGGSALSEHLQVGVAETGVVGDTELGHRNNERSQRRRVRLLAGRKRSPHNPGRGELDHPGLCRCTQLDEGAGEHRHAAVRSHAGIDEVDDDDGVRDDGLAGHVHEHDVGHEGVVQLSEGVASACQHPQRLGGGAASRGAAGGGNRQCVGGDRGIDLDGLDHAVAGDDQAGTRTEGVGEPMCHGERGLGPLL